MKNSIVYLFTLGAVLMLLNSCGPESKTSSGNPPVEAKKPIQTAPMIDYSVVKKYPHNTDLFTEGFLFHDGKLLESTGSPENLPQTRSLIGEHNLLTGEFNQKVELDRKVYFGEGVAVINNFVYQLTYTNQVGFIYDAKTYTRKGQFSYLSKQGWGMATDGTHLIMSDGTNAITYLNPKDFSIAKTISVTENGFALDFLNELEFINGHIYANVWMTDFIVRIDTASGEVTGKLDLTQLKAEAAKENPGIAETNGIAFDKETDRVLVTGKLWPGIYEIKFKH